LGDLNVSVPRRSPRPLLLTALVGLGLACVQTTHADTLPSQPEQPASEQPQPESAIALATEPSKPASPPYVPREQDLVTAHQPIEFPEHLAGFLDALAAVDDGQQDVVRVVHVGASAIGADDLPAILRERFQTRFGDGGAGLVLMSRYMSNYLHRWVKLEASGWDHCYIAYKCLADGHYGLGGAAFWATSGATTTISTRKHELGDEAANIELWYLARPGGGRVEMLIDEGEPIVVDTRAEAVEDRYHSVRVDPGAHSVRVRALGHGSSRVYGVMLETDAGVVWDGFSQLGLFTNRVLEWDAEHLAGQIQHRDPDLIVFAYGGNDLRRVANGKLDHDGYVAEFRAAVEHMRRGKPQASCLITAINDRGKSLTYDIDAEHVEVIVAAQREVARQTGCAFFDTYAAMGGPGSFADWRKRKLAAGDDKHLNHAGRELLGGWMYDAVIAAYVERRKAVAGN
jgi:lysophospholipase L1-like esterase